MERMTRRVRQTRMMDPRPPRGPRGLLATFGVLGSGLLFVQLGGPFWRPWILALAPPLGVRTTGRSFFYHGLFSMITAR